MSCFAACVQTTTCFTFFPTYFKWFCAWKLPKIRTKMVKAAVTSWTATEDLFHSVCLWKGVIFRIGRKTSLVAPENLDFTLLHQTITRKAASNDKTFSMEKLQVTALRILSIRLFLVLNYQRIISRTWKKMNFFLLHQTECCSENNNTSLHGKLQTPPLRLDCYVTNSPKSLILWGAMWSTI